MNSSRFTLYLFASAAFLAAVYLFLTFRIVPVNEDAGTFIPIAKEVLQGAVPTKDVMTWKTPGMYYLTALWMKFFGTAYERVVLLVYLVNVLNCLLLYLALSRFVSSRIPRLLLCLSYFYSALLFEGFWVVLEPFQVAFIFAAYLVYLGRREGFFKYGLAGLLLGCSIMIKQYSVFVLAGFLVAIWLDRPKVVIALFTLLFLGVVLGVLYAGSRFSGYRFDASAVVVALCATVFFETLFLGMKLPFRELRVLKQEQASEAKEINRVFPKGSSVYVIGYRPYVYVTCDFVNPMHDYEFGNAQRPVDDWDRIGSVLIGQESVPSYRSILEAHGFRKVGELEGRAEFFEKSKPYRDLKVCVFRPSFPQS
ncbi:MAG: hypothetical protein M0Z67_06110 [Nitrospiraceae bacterium]|nr:hypothetical protein [Nitrospiraceae bacterium]